MLYDLYLSMGCQTLPAISDLQSEVPALTDPLVQQKMLQRLPRPGFLGLDLTDDLAARLMQRLTSQGAVGHSVPAPYRQPKITREQALPIARQAIEQLHLTLIPDHTLGPIRFREEKPVCWTFSAPSEEWIKEDRIPGALFANIDKLDGHVWNNEEFQQLHDKDS